jgi:hypothetical protein
MAAKRKQAADKTRGKGASVLEALLYMAAGAYAWQLGAWLYDSYRNGEPAKELDEEPPVVVELPPREPSPPVRIPPSRRRVPPHVVEDIEATIRDRMTGGTGGPAREIEAGGAAQPVPGREIPTQPRPGGPPRIRQNGQNGAARLPRLELSDRFSMLEIDTDEDEDE